ncbi:uncharacterized protein METZ01_LOCUS300428 [marine metagenome]|uniref:Uncharacterized protein n=1 Tax=marine metagenome TaxID=408172 RepID=A0A382MF52_9ZZZZ
MMTVEERLDQLEKRNRRLPAGLMMTVVAMPLRARRTHLWKNLMQSRPRLFRL